MNQYVIRNSGDDYWSNEEGWVEQLDMADVFSEREKLELFLPIGGFWQKYESKTKSTGSA